MKRSEMIQIISRNLQKHENMFNGYKNGSIPLKCVSDNLASYILKEIEKVGMLPPGIETDIWNRQDNNYYIINEWEFEE